MERQVAVADAARVRGVIAGAMLSDAARASVMGTVTLHPHQRDAVARLRTTIAELGGALLADDAGLGKTYVAIALAREAEHPLIVAPASLRAMWRDALRATDVRADVTSYSALSRGRVPEGHVDLLVLDEAHHARTPRTRRYARLAELSRAARVLLLSATPIHNSGGDLRALCALFLGERAWGMDEQALARCIVRRERRDVTGSARVPGATPPRWLEVGNDEALLQAILALPPPLPPSDGGDGGALLVWSLVRQWASSQGALAGALRRRLARAGALIAALESGRHPARTELASWLYTGDALQLAFPELVSSVAIPSTTELLALVRAHERELRALLRRVRAASDLDVVRAGHLAAIREAHPGEKVVAFAQYADTIGVLYTHLHHLFGIAALTSAGARVAGGVLSRRDALARFAPGAARIRPPPDAERIDLLLTTDLLSEGVNLQDASVVVHLDLPWTPARMEQRVGRSRRIGARHACTTVYALAPPAAAESLLRAEERLRAKLRIAGRAVGIAGAILPPIAGVVEREDESAARALERLHQLLMQWDQRSPGGPDARDELLVASVYARRDGMLALVDDAGRPTLIAAHGDRAATVHTAVVLDVACEACGEDAPMDESALTRALGAVDEWLTRREAEHAAGGAISIRARPRHHAMQRIAAITARAPHHRRPLLAPLVARARWAAAAPCGIGAERVLATLVSAPMDDEAWLRALGTFGELHAKSSGANADGTAARPVVRAVAVIVLRDAGGVSG